MKSFLLLFAITFMYSGCKKGTYSSAGINSIEGSWELRKIVANSTLSYPPGSGNYLKFTKDTYEQYTGGVLEKNGTYSIVSDNNASETTCTTVEAGQFKKCIIYDGLTGPGKYYFQISDNTLTMITGKGCQILDANWEGQYVKVLGQ